VQEQAEAGIETMIGKTIGNFRITSEIGKGGMGVVYLAEHVSLRKRFAIKSLSQSLSGDPNFRRRFFDEAQRQAGLDHPNIVQVTDFFEESGEFFLVMEYVDGQDLSRLIRAKGRLTESEALPIFRDILKGVGFAHANGLVHRDIKPSNVLVDKGGRARIMDFGIAIIAGGAKKSLTATGLAIGSPWYMSPEQIVHQREVDRRTDIYALGIVLYEMLTGSVPFDGETDFEVKEQQVRATTPDPRKKNPEISPKFADAILKAMAKDPADRFQDCAEFLASIDVLPRAQPYVSPILSRVVQSVVTSVRAWKRVLAKPQKAQPPDRVLTDATLIEPAPSEIHGPSSVKAVLRSRAPDVTGIFPSAAHPGELLLSDVAFTITQSANPSLLGRKIQLTRFPFRIGRADADYIIADDRGISREHLIIDCKAGTFTVCDAGSSNGTYVDGRLIRQNQPEPLFFGAVIRLSNMTCLTFAPGGLEEFPDLTGQTINSRFSLEKLLHASTKAAVYAARDLQFPRRVALKVLSPQLAIFPLYMEQFRREAEMAALLRPHPNICRVLDFGVGTVRWSPTSLVEVPYLCMDLMEGGSLGERVTRGDRVSLEQIASWIEELGNALDEMHRQGVVHSGIKLTSVVVDEQSRPYLTDFAIASRPADNVKGAVIGAPAFLAPEQWEMERPTPATDQFALAVITYILVTGARPYEGQENPDVRRKNFARGPIAAHEEAERNGRSKVAPAVSKVLERALASSQERRFPSVSEFARSLSLAVSGRTEEGPRIFISYHRESSAPWAIHLSRELKQRHGIASFVDTQRRDGAVRFPVLLKRAIEQCDVFVCLLTDTTLASPWVKEEIRLAHEAQKAMVPVFQESFDVSKISSEAEPYIQALLSYDAVHLFDRRNIHIDHSVDDLAARVKRTLDQL